MMKTPTSFQEVLEAIKESPPYHVFSKSDDDGSFKIHRQIMIKNGAACIDFRWEPDRPGNFIELIIHSFYVRLSNMIRDPHHSRSRARDEGCLAQGQIVPFLPKDFPAYPAEKIFAIGSQYYFIHTLPLIPNADLAYAALLNEEGKREIFADYLESIGNYSGACTVRRTDADDELEIRRELFQFLQIRI